MFLTDDLFAPYLHSHLMTTPSPSLPLEDTPVLLVEDDAIARRTASIVLRNLGGTQLEVCVSGDEFAARCTHGLRGVLVLTDVHMPGTPPVDTLRSLPADARPRGVIVLSGDAGPEVDRHVTDLRTAGITMLGMIEKPMSPAKLRALLGPHR